MMFMAFSFTSFFDPLSRISSIAMSKLRIQIGSLFCLKVKATSPTDFMQSAYFRGNLIRSEILSYYVVQPENYVALYT